MTLTGFIGAVCMFPLRAIIAASVALGIHPNMLTLIGVLINVVAAVALGFDHFLLAFVIMIVANIFDFIDGKVAHITNTVSRFGAFWDSTLDRFSDIALFLGLIYLYADLRRTDYVMVASLAMMFSIMTSYARARAESLIEKCEIGFMGRPERIVLFLIGALFNRMAAVLWVILVLAIVAVANRVHYTYLALNNKPIPTGSNVVSRIFWRAFFWHDERATLPYDLWVIAILAFILLTPPDWLGDPTATGLGVWAFLK
ncbi:MAG TPA: CDP-alcohol phosphatidyltransferase family protein [Vicinamibacterales bacterium]|nr:CDP-alcohol phosphatidyltransferase family protein [Vicinamibacterales bacterium]